ncbi:MAG: ThiF family adenylyltransferase [Anaeroplasmataceae bacterium]|nr:ThiF family adenylyltransferase [Anaeroplasmataceae bacterium]
MEERSIPILGEETIDALKHTHIAIFGLGGVGGYVVEALARQGVGCFSIIDFDVIQPSNKNRQILALESTMGHPKTEVCQNRILEINPIAKIYLYNLRIDEETIEQIDFLTIDYVVDCIDDVAGKIAIIKRAKEFGKKVISCCGTANKLDPSKFQIKDISKTSVCPLAKKLRLELKKLEITGVDVLFSTEEPVVKVSDTLPTVSFVPSVAGLLLAGHIILSLQQEVKNNRTHLVLEGGGLKGVYTAGVLDYLLEQNVEFDAVYGVSAGACVGASFISKQKTRGYHSLVDYINDPACASKRSLTKTGNYFNKEFVYYKIPNELIPYDFDAAHQNPCKLYATVTNVETGKAEYYPCLDYQKDIEYICASSSLPMLAEIQWINGKGYLDGGIADSIPYLEAKKNAKKCVVVLTKHKGYLCHKQNPILSKAIQLKYRKYPKLIKTLEQRHTQYNKIQSLMEQDKNVFILRPSKALDIDRLEKDKKKLEATYQLGYEDAKANFEELKKFIEN